MQNEEVIQAKEMLPILVEMGLAEPCEQCREARRLSDLLALQGRYVVLVGEVVTPEDKSATQEVALYGTRVQVRCPNCLDARVVPTQKGYLLIGLVKAFFNSATGRNLDQEAEDTF